VPTRRVAIAFAAAFAGCQNAAPPARPAPEVPVVVRWPEGTRCRAVLAPASPDDAETRAAAIWWREALRQSVAFDVADDGAAGLPRLELAIDRTANALAASLRTNDGIRLLAGSRLAGGDLPAAIDDLAWRTRLALGEAVPTPLPIANGTSRVPRVLLAVDDARTLLADGGFAAAERILRDARAGDGGAPFVLEGLAATALLRGDAAAAIRIAREALGYEGRLLPTTAHRLARTLLLARAVAEPAAAGQRDAELLTLATVARRERPHDPEPVLSAALAHDFRGEFALARPLLESLRERLPLQPVVDYHLGWACLGSGDAAAACAPFARAAARLPAAWVLLPQAIALHESGQAAALRDLLAAQAGEAAPDDAPLLYDVLRLQAAQALLAGDAAAARTSILAALQWLGRHPQALAVRAGEFAEQGDLLIRLGGGDDLPGLLAAVQMQHAGTPIADVCTFLGGMRDVQRTSERLPAVERMLAAGGDSPWALLLAAFAHELRGEVADRQQALTRAAQLADSPMTKALLARGLAATGAHAEATQLLRTLRTELRTLRMREACRHPLRGPELACVFVDD